MPDTHRPPGTRLRPHPRAAGHARRRRRVRAPGAVPARRTHGRRGMVAGGGVRAARPQRLPRRHRAGGATAAAGADLFTSGLVLQAISRWNHALGARLGRARQSVRQQHLSQCQRGAAPALPAGPVLGQARRRPGTHRAGRRLGCPGLDAHHAPAGRAITTCSTAPSSTSPTGRWPMCCWCMPRPHPSAVRRASRRSSSRRTSQGFKVAQKLTKMGFRGSQTAELVLHRLPGAGGQPGGQPKTAGSRW